jgi:uncharacterized protein YjbJ (UPF0337 family)
MARIPTPGCGSPAWHDYAADKAGTNVPLTWLPVRRGFKRCRVLNNKETAMDWNLIEGNWRQLKGKIREKWGHLTEDDLDKIAGKREQLEGKIQERYGMSKDAVKKELDDWMKTQH